MAESTATIAKVARAYRDGTLSPIDVTGACLARVAEREPRLRAFATVTADRARAQARRAADAVGDDPQMTRPLLGIPVGVKDIVDVAGVATGAGCAALAEYRAATDASAWRRLAEAGAVLVGKTQTHELAYGVATPPTRNPVDATRMPGGSSGGSAAAVAAGLCLGAIGTDTAGSIRIPAGLCGVVGYKPTRGLVPTDGVLPLAPTLDHVGQLALTAPDAALLVAAMAGAAVDPVPVFNASARPDAVLDGLRVGLATTDVLWTSAVHGAVDTAATAMTQAGADVRAVPTSSFADAVWHSDRVITVEAGVVHADLLAAAGDALTTATRVRLETADRIDGPAYYRAVKHADAVLEALDAALSDADVLLAPGVATTAPAYGAESVTIGGRELRLGRALCWNTAAANMAGVPAISLPAGVADDRLPVSIQLIGPRGGDTRLLAVAAAVEALLAVRSATGDPMGDGPTTQATLALDEAGVSYRSHPYEHDPAAESYGLEAAGALGVAPEQVFKTLMVDVEGDLVVAIVPVTASVRLKALATAFGGKRAWMADVAVAERRTGYVVGGISPFGQKRTHQTVVDETAELFDTVFVSGGRRGFDVELAPADLIRVTKATVADIAR